jgi:hypothetical protein
MGHVKTPADRDILTRVEKWFPGAKKEWDPHHDRFTRITRFTKSNEPGVRWEPKTYAKRIQEGRLCLDENLLGPFVNQVVNDIKQSEFSIQVKGKDSGTDPKLAKVRQGLHRGVQQIGGWKPMLGRCADDLVTGGLCAARLLTAYENPMSFRKEIQYQAVDPVRMYHGDGTHRKSNFADVTDSLVYEPYALNKFKAEFDRDPSRYLGNDSVWGSNNTGPWVSEYFFKQEDEARLAMTVTGREMLLSDLKEVLKSPNHAFFAGREDLQLLAGLGQLQLSDLIANDPNTGEPIIRDTETCQIWWVKMAAREILSKEAWPGTFIPNFVGVGRKVVIEGVTYYYGLAEPAMDAQMRHNYAVTMHTERLSYSPKIPIWMPIQGVPAGHKEHWDNINQSMNAVGYYNAYDPENPERPLPPPQRAPSVQSDPGFLDLQNITQQGIKGTLGMWETSLAAPSAETSGIAIRTRERQADTGNFDWGANLAEMAEHMAYATDEILPKVIDIPQQVRIVGEDDKEAVIWAASLEEGAPDAGRYFNLNQGKFDFLVKMVPGADTKRDEANILLQEIFRAVPGSVLPLGPAYIRNSEIKDAEGAAKLLERWANTQSPGLFPQEEQQQDPRQMQAAMAQMQQTLAQMQDALSKLGPENERLKIENQAIKADKTLEAERVKIEWFKAQTEAKAKSVDGQVKTGDLALKADQQQHDKQMDKAGFQLDAQAAAHGQAKDGAEFDLKARGQAHSEAKDRASFAQAGEKMRLDHEAKTSAKENPTGGKPGSSSDRGR